MKKERAISISLTNGAECICDPDIVLGDKYGLWDVNNEVSPRGTLLDLNTAWELFISKQGLSGYTFERQEDSEHERITYILVDQDKNPVGPEFTVETDNGEILVPITETVTSLTAEKGKYYKLDAPVETLAVTLPAMDTVTSVKKVGIYFTAGTTPAVTITSADNKLVVFQDGYMIESGMAYEIKCLYNGAAWVVGALTIKPPFFTKLSLDDGEVVEIQGSGELTEAMVSPYQSSLVSAEIGKLCTSIGTWAFYSCKGLTNITIGSGVTSIGSFAFMYCQGLTSVTIPNSVTSIGISAFRDCSGLTSVTIGSGVTNIDNYAFSDCSGLTSIVVNSANTVYDSRDNCNAIINTSTNELIAGCKNTVIPSSVTSVGYYAFYGCTGLTSITIPNSVTSIDDSAFEQCSGLTSITIPNGVTSIGDMAFSDCSGLTSITSLATTAPTIKSSTFRNVKTGGTLTVPRGSTGYDVWMGTGNYYLGKYGWVIPFFVKLSLDDGEVVEIQGSGELTQAMITPYKSSVVGAEFGKLCTSIGNGAFTECTGLTSVTIPNSVTSIDQEAFRNCTGLTSITCNAITAPTIQSNTFQNVKTGGTLSVPNGSTGYDTWMGTGNYYLGKYGWVIPFLAKLSLDDGEVVEIQGSGELTEEMVSPYQSSLVSAEIGESCTSIGEDVFRWRSGLTSITIPDSVTSIGNNAFFFCSGLNSINIPNSVTSIGQNAFSGCTGLTSITSLATTAPTIQNNTFRDVKTGGTLTVPSGSTGYDEWMSYLGMYNWKKVEQ